MEIKKYRFDGSREFSQDRFDPVSYTHLDVYKRQVKRLAQA